MSATVKSLSVGNGDMFYIKHGSNNFTIIDCNMNEENQDNIINEIVSEKKDKRITRFISTHPDEDHLKGLKYLDKKINILNFYCVDNNATEKNPTEDFDYYCKLRDGDAHYYAYKGCKRKWMNDNDSNDGKSYGSSGINFLWPNTSDEDYKKALSLAAEGTSFNNISPVFTYSLEGGVKIMWMGDIEHDFLEKIKDKIVWPKINILFAPHHGRNSGKVSSDVLKKLNPKIIIIGEALSKDLDYYNGYNTITQNAAKDIVFQCIENMVHIYVSNDNYSYDVSFLTNEKREDNEYGHYLGSFNTKEE